MKIVPLMDTVVLKREAPESVTPSGIVIPDQNQEKMKTGIVVGIGPGKPGQNGIRPAEGDRVLFSAYTGMDFSFQGETYLVLKEEDVLAVLQ